MLKIISNNKSHLLLDWNQLPQKAQADFDYLDDPESGDFFQYKGQYYDLSEFLAVQDHDQNVMKGWDGYIVDSAFSGIVIKFEEYDRDRIIVGRWLDVSDNLN